MVLFRVLFEDKPSNFLHILLQILTNGIIRVKFNNFLLKTFIKLKRTDSFQYHHGSTI